MTARAFTLLLVEPDDGCAEEVEVALRTAGVGCRRVADAEAGWREFARARPDTVLTAWQTPRQSGAWFLRRLHEDYMGALPPVYALFSPEELLATPPGEELDAAFLRPFSPGGVARSSSGENSA